MNPARTSLASMRPLFRGLISLLALIGGLTLLVAGASAMPGMPGGKMPPPGAVENDAPADISADGAIESLIPLPEEGAGDPRFVAHLIERLASADFAGRRCGDPRGASLRAYLCDQLLRAGLRPAGLFPDAAGTAAYEQSFAVSAETLASLDAALIGPDGRRVELVLSLREAPERLAETTLRLWPEGTDPPACDSDVLLLRFGPSKGGRMFLPSEFLKQAVAAGAAGMILLPHPDDTRNTHGRYVARSEKRDRRLYSVLGKQRGGLMAYVRPGEESRLFSGKVSTSGEGLLSGPWKLELPAGKSSTMTGVNLVADLGPAHRADLPDLLLIAHYDHLGLDGDLLFPGANDNASGVATLLETARLLSGKSAPFNLRVLFADGEELGLLGSQAYSRVYESPDLVINIDSVGRAATNNFRTIRDTESHDPLSLLLWSSMDESPELDGLLARALEFKFNVKRGRGAMLARGGDHATFAEMGVPSIFIFGGYEMSSNDASDGLDGILPERPALLAGALAAYLGGE